MKKIKLLVVAAASLCAFQVANAQSYTITDGPKSTVAGATMTDFDTTSPDYTGGVIYDNTNLGPDALPFSSPGKWWQILAGQTGVVTIAGGASYYGFLWGSPDAFNTVTFYDGDTVLASYEGTRDFIPRDDTSHYFNFMAGAGQVITSVHFDSSDYGFETDNHAFTAAVPEPETYALMLAGLGVVGFLARRRRAV